MSELQISQICSIEGCNQRFHARMLCKKHYLRWWTHGDPLIIKRIARQGVGATFQERFWSLVSRKGKDECWLWQGSLDKEGYGTLKKKRILFFAHRLAWSYTFQKTTSLHILHSCDNPPCCNPNHLREGTQQDNMRDRQKRGRQVCKLTPQQVRLIRTKIANGIRQKDLALQFNVTPSAISHLNRGATHQGVL